MPTEQEKQQTPQEEESTDLNDVRRETVRFLGTLAVGLTPIAILMVAVPNPHFILKAAALGGGAVAMAVWEMNRIRSGVRHAE